MPANGRRDLIRRLKVNSEEERKFKVKKDKVTRTHVACTFCNIAGS